MPPAHHEAKADQEPRIGILSIAVSGEFPRYQRRLHPAVLMLGGDFRQGFGLFRPLEIQPLQAGDIIAQWPHGSDLAIGEM